MNASSFQITDICEVKTMATKQVEQEEAARKPAAKTETDSNAPAAAVVTPNKENELIQLDTSTVSLTSKLDGFTLDDINDDDFNPRADSDDADSAEENALTFSPPATAPPPAPPAAAPAMILSPPPQIPAPTAPAIPARDKLAGSSAPNFSGSIFASPKEDIFAPNKNPFGGPNDPFGKKPFFCWSNIPLLEFSENLHVQIYNVHIVLSR